MENDPLFQHYLEDFESPANDDYRKWLMLLDNVVEDDIPIDIDLEQIIITYRRICEYKGITYAFNHSVEYDGFEYNTHVDVDSVKRVYPKEITKIIYVEEL
jgi:hypothetical protein